MRPWLAAVVRVAALLLAGLLAGWVLGSTAVWLAVLLGGALLWHLGQLYATLHWLKRAETEDPPDAPGLWGDLTAQLRSLLFRDRKRERRLAALLKEYQDSTSAMPDAAYPPAVLKPEEDLPVAFASTATDSRAARSASILFARLRSRHIAGATPSAVTLFRQRRLHRASRLL